LKHAFS
jgi:hypothetical protein